LRGDLAIAPPSKRRREPATGNGTSKATGNGTTALSDSEVEGVIREIGVERVRCMVNKLTLTLPLAAVVAVS
jgi:hypothetical protein